jgi:hypothetical protein
VRSSPASSSRPKKSNTSGSTPAFLIGEGEIDEEREGWWLTTYVCVNEDAQGPPAIGAEPPDRFRQRGATQN